MCTGTAPLFLVQLGVNNLIASLSINDQLSEFIASGYALVRHLDQDTEKKQLSSYLRRETLGICAAEILAAHYTGYDLASQTEIWFL